MNSPVKNEKPSLSTPSSDVITVSPTPSKAVNDIYSFIDQLSQDKRRNSKNILHKIDTTSGNSLSYLTY